MPLLLILSKILCPCDASQVGARVQSEAKEESKQRGSVPYQASRFGSLTTKSRKAPSAEKILLHFSPSLIRPYHCYFVSLLDVDGVPSNRKLQIPSYKINNVFCHFFFQLALNNGAK